MMNREEAWIELENKVREIGTSLDDLLGLPRWIILADDRKCRLTIRMVEDGEILFDIKYEQPELKPWPELK